MAEQAFGCQKEHPPAALPKRGIGAVGRPQHRHDRRGITVEIIQPVARGMRVMVAVPTPFRLGGEEIREAMHQVMARHDATGEKMLCNPIGLFGGVKPVRCGAMGKHMDEDPAIRFQPGFHLGE